MGGNTVDEVEETINSTGRIRNVLPAKILRLTTKQLEEALSTAAPDGPQYRC